MEDWDSDCLDVSITLSRPIAREQATDVLFEYPSELNEELDSLKDIDSASQQESNQKYVLVADNSNKVFVSNISFRSSQQSLWKAFEQFGKVRHCHLFLEHRGLRSKGCATITFDNEESALNALAVSDQFSFHNRLLHIERAKRKRFCPTVDAVSDEWDVRLLSPEGSTLADTTSVDGSASSCGCSTDKKDVDISNRPFASGSDEALSVHVGLHPVTTQTHACTSQSGDIQLLNDHVMLHIFRYLSFSERMLCERVCRSWLNISLLFWRQMKRLDFKNVCLQMQLLTDTIMKNVLKRVSPSMLALHIDVICNAISDQTLNLIAAKCPNIHELVLGGSMTITDAGLKTIANCCKDLKMLTLHSHKSKIGENGLWWIFHRCKQLQIINLDNCHKLKGHCFHVLGNDVLKLSLQFCTKLTDTGTEKIALRCTNLRELNVGYCNKLTNQSLQNITKINTLVHLHFEGNIADVSGDGLKMIQNLNCLEELCLKENLKLTDEVLIVISRGCRRLRSIDISQMSPYSLTDAVTDAGLVALADNCNLLSKLDITNLSQVTDDALLALGRVQQLSSLRARNCELFTDSGVCCVLINCPHLELLDLTGCLLVSNISLDVAIDKVRQMTSPRLLKLNVTGTSVEVSDWALIPRELQLDCTNNICFDDDYSDYSDTDGDDFLDNDDPLHEERWNHS